jgi:hypothetical protein
MLAAAAPAEASTPTLEICWASTEVYTKVQRQLHLRNPGAALAPYTQPDI